MPGFLSLAYHTADIQYLFPLWHGGPAPPSMIHSLNKKQTDLSDQLVAAWTNFAWTGNPNGLGNYPWPRYTQQLDQAGMADPGHPGFVDVDGPAVSTRFATATSGSRSHRNRIISRGCNLGDGHDHGRHFFGPACRANRAHCFFRFSSSSGTASLKRGIETTTELAAAEDTAALATAIIVACRDPSLRDVEQGALTELLWPKPAARK